MICLSFRFLIVVESLVRLLDEPFVKASLTTTHLVPRHEQDGTAFRVKGD